MGTLGFNEYGVRNKSVTKYLATNFTDVWNIAPGRDLVFQTSEWSTEPSFSFPNFKSTVEVAFKKTVPYYKTGDDFRA